MGDENGQPKKIEDFSKFIGTFSSHYNDNYDNQTTVTEEERKKRQETAPQIADSYYDFASTAYEVNWSTHFHYTPFPPTYPPHDNTLATAMLLYEHRLAYLLQLRPNSLILDVGCGIGGPARSIARLTGCTVIGLTINQSQVDRAIYLTEMEGLSHQVSFVKGDFLDMPFADESFDAVIAIEATCHSPSLERVYREVNRVLKPGGMFGTSEWVLTNKFDEKNQRHVGIRNRIERGNGLSNLHTCKAARNAFLAAGFELEHEEDYASHFEVPNDLESSIATQNSSPILIPFKDGPRLAPAPSTPLPTTRLSLRPWTFPLRGEHRLATTWTDWWTCFKMSPLMRRLCYWFVYFGEKIGIVDKGVMQAMQTMAVCVDSVVEGGQEGVFSPCWWFIGRKGEDDVKKEEDGGGRATRKDLNKRVPYRAENE
ncbi:Delta(24)-sterol C-methyltransferase [Cladophialophora chaetospira]|uniref:Sterol 24-C-methyltransferase n=1 Tax=Cladophialophora chaetospira TaxID=386627 RepID=A0AA38X7L9_9EURO|nr:Delta(24)-sterol C-methyltransferase [Cladophialophora chaetospira]